MFYKISGGQCNTECGCGEGLVKNYKDPITGAIYDACVQGQLCIETVTIQTGSFTCNMTFIHQMTKSRDRLCSNIRITIILICQNDSLSEDRKHALIYY